MYHLALVHCVPSCFGSLCVCHVQKELLCVVTSCHSSHCCSCHVGLKPIAFGQQKLRILSFHVFTCSIACIFLGPMINVTAIDAVPVLTDVCAGRLLVPTQMTILMDVKPISSTTFTINASLLDLSNIVEMTSSH